MCLFISISAYAAEMSYTDGTLTISGLEENAVLIHTSYENGRMSDLNVTNATNGTQKVNAENGDKFFVWSSIGNAKPLCDPVVVGETPKPVTKKTLVVYYSAQNHTRRVAEYIKTAADADIFEIVPQNIYTSADLNWTNSNSCVVYEYEHPEARDIPLVTTTVPNWEDYDTVFIGYPNWWGDMPMILYTFFESCDFSGKTIITFNTHGGSGFSNTVNTIRSLEPNANVIEGLSISRNHIQDAKDEIVEWVNGLK